MAIRFTIFPQGEESSPSTIDFDLDKIVIGRGAVCDLRLPHPAVSYSHATVEVDGGRYTIRDSGSLNGTKVNGSRIPPDYRHPIRSDDVIEIVDFKIVPTLSVPMQGAHSDERTETLARELLRSEAASLGAARLEVVEGPDAGAALDLPMDPGARVRIGDSEECEMRITGEEASGIVLELSNGISGWHLESTSGDVTLGDGRRRSVRLADGQMISLGCTRMRFLDPLDAYYSRLLATREELDASIAPARTRREPETPPAAPPPPPVIVDLPLEPLSSRTEVVDVTRGRSRLPEYTWMVVTLGILAFLASLGLLVVLMF
jgi:pSer/pThr/pTyr-binding forkhead associated (FHA) protein